MADIRTATPAELRRLEAELEGQYRALQARGLTLDMTRGKPCAEQLDLSAEMLTMADVAVYAKFDGLDTRNYGALDGLPSAKALFGAILDVRPDEVIVGNNSSLSLMYDTMVRAVLFGVPGGAAPWGKQPARFLCPSPGYDRHFTICEQLGIEMITVDMRDDGPDMDAVERLARDETVKGIWCVPKYSNPTGAVYSDEVVERLARMRAAPDFRIFWDNAYAVHFLQGSPAHLRSIVAACAEAGNPDRPILFGSMAKVTLAGAGMAAMAGSKRNMDWTRELMSAQTIGPDKTNQLRHVLFLRDMPTMLAHMARHAEIVRPKFEAVQSALERDLGGTNVASWTRPQGGYFVSLDTMDGCAKAVVQMAAEAGVRLTPAGATFPYRTDPRDRNIRIAPTFPPLEEVRLAMDILTICVRRVTIQRLLAGAS